MPALPEASVAMTNESAKPSRGPRKTTGITPEGNTMDEVAHGGNVELPLLPLKNVVVFPRTIVNLTVGRTRSVQALNSAMSTDRRLVVIAQKSDEHDEPLPGDLYATGTMVEVRQVRRQPDSSLQVEVEALCRVSLKEIGQEEPCLIGRVVEIDEVANGEKETEALM